jgi:hypothetical protein
LPLSPGQLSSSTRVASVTQFASHLSLVRLPGNPSLAHRTQSAIIHSALLKLRKHGGVNEQTTEKG